MLQGLQESEIKAAIDAGGRSNGIVIVERADERGCLFVVYIRPSWRRGFHILRTFRDRGDREYRDLRLLLRHVRDVFLYHGPITIHRAGHPALRRFRNLSSSDICPTAPLVIAAKGTGPEIDDRQATLAP